MNEAPPLLRLFDALTERDALALAKSTVIGAQHIGSGNAMRLPGIPVQTLAMPVLYPETQTLYDIWMTREPCRASQIGDIAICSTDEMLFGTIAIDDSALRESDKTSTLRTASERAYREIFQLLDRQNYPHLWRVWNYIPDIHGEEAGLERYRQFNIGRHDAFAAAQRTVDSSPAASALGTQSGLLSIAFIAGRREPVRIENPRQISAYTYPSQYGPSSPTFSRAVTVAEGCERILFISGTASIVGHTTMHTGDAVAQTLETVANLSALLQQTNTANCALSLIDLAYRIYIRHARDLTPVRQALEKAIGGSPHAVYVQADICRTDLLVEIEAFAVMPGQ